jgi:hypothetical protein
MKKRIKFKKKPDPEYYSEKGILYCRGLPFKVYESSKLAKLAAERWNTKHEQAINNAKNNMPNIRP